MLCNKKVLRLTLAQRVIPEFEQANMKIPVCVAETLEFVQDKDQPNRYQPREDSQLVLLSEWSEFCIMLEE